MEREIWNGNVKLIAAFVPDVYGTHHSKILVLFRSDDTAQVVVQTGINLSPPRSRSPFLNRTVLIVANMIPFDHEHVSRVIFADLGI
jgi:Tyrosyl-DNA phosphodiesterase